MNPSVRTDIIRQVLILLLLALAPGLLAMGGDGGDPGATRIPELEKDFAVLLVDQQGRATELTSFSIDGNGFLLGELGKAQVAIPFEKINRLEFSNTKGNRITCTAFLLDGKQVEVLVKTTIPATGKTGYGNFLIKLRAVTKITFQK